MALGHKKYEPSGNDDHCKARALNEDPKIEVERDE